MKILVTGSSGLVGSALVPFLRNNGFVVTKLIRTHNKLSDDEITWDPESGMINPAQLEGFDAVVNLAGESIASKRWSEARKKKILESRKEGTKTLCMSLASLSKPPKVLINASAMGFYGNKGDTVLTENSPKGKGFLAHVCEEWETATLPAQQKDIRVVCLRIGIVLTPRGGALGQMLIPFKLGLGGVLGSGNQYMSWITLDELLQVILHTLLNNTLRGSVNVSTPFPVTNREFTKILGSVLHRPTVLAVPAFLLRLILGEMADELLLSSTRMMPDRLLESGYHFQSPRLEGALSHLLS